MSSEKPSPGEAMAMTAIVVIGSLWSAFLYSKGVNQLLPLLPIQVPALSYLNTLAILVLFYLIKDRLRTRPDEREGKYDWGDIYEELVRPLVWCGLTYLIVWLGKMLWA